MRYIHPMTGAVIEGRSVEVGEKIERADAYDSTTGRWEPVPSALVGMTIRSKRGAMLVRPDVCLRCGATGGRHKGGCALAPAMYKTTDGVRH